MPFSQLKLHASLLEGLRDLGFHQPTPIQSDAIPPALEGRDVLACAMTGSGKTVAFLLPILHHLIGKPRRTTRALVLTPTRELAAQILEDLTDRMLDMGFLPDIRRVLKHLPRRRQTLFFSATMPPDIAQLAREMLRDPVVINRQRRSQPATGITQAVYPVAQHHKTGLLLALLHGGEVNDALVFTRTKHRADRLAKQLGRERVSVQRIHGNRSQAQRTEALSGFKDGRFRVLIATDIAARGIDVADVSHVVNFDCPHLAEDYIHRVGRTARADATGDAYTLMSPEEEADMRAIERAIGKALPRVTLPDFDYRKAPAPGSDGGPPRPNRLRRRDRWRRR
jgi:ATP-dependent RNA helicase RhlE